MRRFTRLTNAFSKKLENHAAISLGSQGGDPAFTIWAIRMMRL